MDADRPRAKFLVTLRQSRLLDSREVDRLTAAHPAASGREIADALVSAGALTHYQADKLLRGVWQGLTLGPYRILAPLGRGGMGTVVYLARDSRRANTAGDADLVALKLLPHRKAEAEPKVFVRFRREMSLGKRVDHPNVVHTLGSGELDAVHFVALEYVPGRSLRRLVAESGPLSVGDAARVFADVAAGLDHIHARGLVHRDVTPANIMVRPDGRAVVLDLGLAYAPKEPLLNDPSVVGGRGYAVGTMDYIAPEQVRHATAVGPSADLYGLGCSLVFALTGRPPFPAKTTKEKLQRHRTDPPPPLAGVPPVFRGVVYRLMAKDPDERPRSAAEARELLSAWATAAQPRSAVDAIALADAPGADAGLWDAAPGEELPLAEEMPKWELVHDLDDENEEDQHDEPKPRRRGNERPRAGGGCAGVVLLALVALGVWRAM